MLKKDKLNILLSVFGFLGFFALFDVITLPTPPSWNSPSSALITLLSCLLPVCNFSISFRDASFSQCYNWLVLLGLYFWPVPHSTGSVCDTIQAHSFSYRLHAELSNQPPPPCRTMFLSPTTTHEEAASTIKTLRVTGGVLVKGNIGVSGSCCCQLGAPPPASPEVSFTRWE